MCRRRELDSQTRLSFILEPLNARPEKGARHMPGERSSSIDEIALSKTIAHALRHQPQLYGLQLDEEGWVKVQDLLAALGRRRAAWRHLGEEDLVRLIAHASKQRYELREGKIRALYGHSLPGRLAREEAPPPALLYHGTHPVALARIRLEGLQPMRRQYVHLSVDVSTARQVALRRTRYPVILTVLAQEAYAHGVRFYRGNDLVWLAEAIPPAFLRFH
jgi:putative RNA 2'-phosphotransferase